MYMSCDQFIPLRGASYIPTPAWISAKKCSINVKNTCQECFRYAITSSQRELKDKNKERFAIL